nr:glycosyltransferase family 1 protein [Bacillota bacterium]
MRIAFLVQRFGLDVNGGAELHCRLVAEHLASDFEVEVLSSCALDYVSWRDHYTPGEERIDGVLLRRFRTKQTRDERRFGLISQEVFSGPSTIEKQRLWLREQGPFMPDLVEFLRKNINRYDILIPFSFRYYHSYECVRLFGDKSILVPTAEPDPAVELPIFQNTFQKPSVILYNSPESKVLVETAHHNYSVPSIITGVGIEEKRAGDINETLAKYSLVSRPYIIYIGRIDKNKGCEQLFDYFIDYIAGDNRPKPE